jgi:hypothetical protein
MIFKTPRTIDSLLLVPGQTIAIALEGGAASKRSSHQTNRSSLSKMDL